MQTNFEGHEGQDSIIVRGAMHHAVMTRTEFAEWLEYENCSASPWMGGTYAQICSVHRPDGSIRSKAMKISSDAFEGIDCQ